MPFANKRFLAEIGRTAAGSIRIHIRPAGESRNHRQLAACIYDLAAELERRSDDLGTRWVVSPAAYDSRLDLELVEGDNLDGAERLVKDVLAAQGLA